MRLQRLRKHALQRQIDSLKVTIEQQIRSSMLDVQSSAELVKVAQSNVGLATEQLQQASDRFAAGVDDNLPVGGRPLLRWRMRSQGGWVRLFQYNQSKLMLASEYWSVVETQYKVYLGR